MLCLMCEFLFCVPNSYMNIGKLCSLVGSCFFEEKRETCECIYIILMLCSYILREEDAPRFDTVYKTALHRFFEI